MSYLVSALPDDELLLNCTDTVTSVLQNIKCIIQYYMELWDCKSYYK